MIRINRGLITTNRMFSAVFGALWFGVVTWAAIGIFDNSQPTEVLTCPMEATEAKALDCTPGEPRRKMLTPEIYSGEPLRIETTAIPHRICDTRVVRVVYDTKGERHVLQSPTDYSAGTPGVIGEPLTFIYTVPTEYNSAGDPIELAPGEATYVSQGFFICNGWQRWFGPIEGDLFKMKFTVKPRTEEEQGALDSLRELLNKGRK